MKFKFIYGTNDSEIEQKVNDFLATGVKVIDWKCMHVVDDVDSYWVCRDALVIYREYENV
ncbi:MAG: hypothetical protein SPG57_02790 [Limosilactobacillus mucosae]|nr:hypothetical protein [Limosilactobacillus mucosae]MDY5412782.1 hypothetical protein [Limosilactobacillus mucosae]